MRFNHSTQTAHQVKASALVLPVFEGAKGPQAGPGVDKPLVDAYKAAKLRGKRGENLMVTGRGSQGYQAEAVLLVGAGKSGQMDAGALLRFAGRVLDEVRRFGDVATTLPLLVSADEAAGVAACVESAILASYRFDRYRSAKDANGALKSVTLLGDANSSSRDVKAAIKQAQVTAESVCWARDLVNTPSGDLPPSRIAEEARKLAASSPQLTAKIWTERELVRDGFGGIMGVGKGSANPPRFIFMQYKGAGTGKPMALSGKGVSFDSGGLSLKDPKGMETMKEDMSGAASILATMRALSLLKPKINVIAAIPSAENMPSGSAQRPGDVIHHYGGTTSEVLNTDAEGRLILADALAYLAERKPSLIIDTATLTGACAVALGTDIAGVFGNDEALVSEVVEAGKAVGEPSWPMPLYRDYRRLIDSPIADIKNIGDRYGGAITAALFLAEFVGETPWVHMDIAGPAFLERPHELGPRGATGFPVRTLIRFLLDRASEGKGKTR